MPSELHKLSSSARGVVLGNGVHLCMLYAWNLYIEAHTVRKETLEGFVPRSVFEAATPTPEPESESQLEEA